MSATLPELLKRVGGLDQERVDDCLRLQRETGQGLDKILLQKGYLDEAAVLRLFGEYLGYEFRPELRVEVVPPDFMKKVPVQFARSYNLCAIGRQDGVLQIATCSPMDVHPMDDLAAMVGGEVEPVLAPRAEITTLINRSYKHQGDLVDEALDRLDDEDIVSLSAEIEEGEDLLDVAHKAPIIKLVNMVLFQALKMRASDIHIHPYSDRVQIRYRVDGILYDMEAAPKKVHDAIVSRVKVMGKMDIAERRLPQDGRATLRVGQGDVDVRISTVPTSYGERIVMRLLDKTMRVLKLEEIGLDEDHLTIISKYLAYTHGMIFLTGPTGSGKTTTLYGSLSRMDSKKLNILTIEDPIEYNLEGISQVQVNEKKGLTFATGLRSFLRQDPDVMMVGEVRDRETADIAIRAALTGHLVFSTVHTNDAASTVTRLLDIGIEPYLVSSSLLLVIAQRLLRRICPRCRTAVVPDKATEKKLKTCGLVPDVFPEGKVTVGTGCDFCFGSGFVERIAIYEMLQIDDVVKEQVMDRANATNIKKSAIERGVLRTLRMDGIQKVLRGVTTIDEVLRVTQQD
ncbi:MAG: Flp pilus assembly complex ATPase component TadA [Planctomycetes bacterium]|nr:Flp pilus assembly complex ATPase component TadA [Planctomycetota bacterium]